jgi:hypothetical protein
LDSRARYPKFSRNIFLPSVRSPNGCYLFPIQDSAAVPFAARYRAMVNRVLRVFAPRFPFDVGSAIVAGFAIVVSGFVSRGRWSAMKGNRYEPMNKPAFKSTVAARKPDCVMAAAVDPVL